MTVPRRTCPSASVTGRASAPARTGCLSCVAKAGASTRMPVPLLGRGLESERPVGLRHRRLRHGRRPGWRPAAAGRRPPRGSRSRRRPALPARPRPAPRGRGPSAAARLPRPRRPSRRACRAPAAPPGLPRTTAGRPHPPARAPSTANVPSGRVVPEASGFGRSSRRASRRAAAKPSSNGSTATATPGAGLPSTSTRPRISPAGATAASAVGTPAGNRRPRTGQRRPRARGGGTWRFSRSAKVRRS